MADEQPELHGLTKMLLLRMDVHPEEFFDTVGHPAPYKWRHALQSVENYGRPEDRRALHDAYMDHALQAALKVLLAQKEPADIGVGQSSSGISAGIPSAYGGSGACGGNIGPSLTQQQIQAMIQQAHQAPMQRAQQSNSVTIPASTLRAMGLKPATAKETLVEAYERIKKRLGL